MKPRIDGTALGSITVAGRRIEHDIPGAFVKNGEDRLIVLNQVARKVVEERRGIHPEFVFTYRGKPAKKYGGGFRPDYKGAPV